uniref:SPE1 n=1 Tax=Arundo donax TaxID=35708 RepID=A0A0A9D5G1_ARUDO
MALSLVTTDSICAALRPNLPFSPDVEPKWPACLVRSFARMPTTGRTPRRRLASTTISSSSSCSSTMTVLSPMVRAMSARETYASSL